jgi:hypothetical protein
VQLHHDIAPCYAAVEYVSSGDLYKQVLQSAGYAELLLQAQTLFACSTTHSHFDIAITVHADQLNRMMTMTLMMVMVVI